MHEQDELFIKSMLQVNSHVQAHEKRRNSRVEQQYSKVLRSSTLILGELGAKGDFETVLKVEKTLQQQDLEKYSQNASVKKSVLEGIDDLNNGIVDYKTLLNSPETYMAKAYVKRDMAGPDKSVPLDSMRKALRSQASRVGNYARNPMANDDERDFLNARVALIRKAEKLYDRIQRDRLSGDEGSL